MAHHALCDEYGGDDGWGRKSECLCAVIEASQRDMLARCIAAVEAFDHDPLCMGDDIYCCSRNVTLNVLRALDGAS
jgi:hypothetical protein